MTPPCANGCGRKAFFRTKGNPKLRSEAAHDLCFQCWTLALKGVRRALPVPEPLGFYKFMPLRYYEAKVALARTAGVRGAA